MCLGIASVAKKLTDALQARLDDCRRRGDVNGLKELANMVVEGHFSCEARRLIRCIRKGENKHQGKQLELFGGSEGD